MTRRTLSLFICLWFAAQGMLALTEGCQYSLSLDGKLTLFVENGSTGDGANGVLWPETKVAAQRWALEFSDEGISLLNVNSGKYLAPYGVRKAGTRVAMRSGSFSQRYWTFTPVDGEEDTYTISMYTSAYGTVLIGATGTGQGASLKLVGEEEADPTLTHWRLVERNDVETAFSPQMRDDIVEGFMKQYYHTASTGHVLGKGGWWGDAEMFETILDAFETTGSTKYKTYFDELYKNFVSRNGTDWSGNSYNDDITWMVLACIRAYRFFGTGNYRAYAKANFDKMYKRAQCFPEGMLRWCEGKESTNSCINGPAIVAACYLFEALGDSSYLDKAKATYAGQRKRLFVSSSGRVYDCGVWSDNTFRVSNEWSSTYNQGTMLGAAVKLWRLTGEEQYLRDARNIYQWTHQNLTDKTSRVINVCQTVDGDLCGFKGIFMRYARLFAEEADRPDVLEWIASNAFYAYQNRNSKGVIWSKWLTKTAENLRDGDKNITNDAFGASTAVSAAANAHVGTLFYKDAFSPIGVKDFNDIRYMQLTTDATETDELVTTVATKEDAYVCFKNVQFAEREATLVAFRAKATNTTTRVAVYLDGLAPDCKVAESDALPEGWNTVTLSIPPTTGTHSVYLVMLKSGKVAFHTVWFGDATAIHPIGEDAPAPCPDASAGISSPSVCYDLGGRQLSESCKGVVIMDGRKVLVR